MSKVGRPKSKNPRSDQYILRLTKDESKMLDKTCEMTRMQRSDTLRKGLRLLYDKESSQK